MSTAPGFVNDMASAYSPDGGTGVRAELTKGPAFSVVALVEALVEDASRMRSSDIHLDPAAHHTKIRFRIDGVLQDIDRIQTAVHSEVISRIKILCGLRTDEHHAAQDGRFRYMLVNGNHVDVRVSIVPTYFGENTVMRLLSDQAEAFTLESLGFTSTNRDKILRAMRQPHGMILPTGPTGSGKTTTLYTLVKMLNVADVSIVTIEDPIEYSVAGVNQIQVNERTNLTFANGLRSLLRQDPNIIMVGEIRDVETAGIAVNTALTGHLVLSTLHTNDAPTTLPRLLDMKVEPYLIASTVNIAIGQRLVRRICVGCREPQKLTTAEVHSLRDILPQELRAADLLFFRGMGCDHCNGTGYSGRAGIHEVLEITPAIREGILRKISSGEIRELAIQHGMVPMIEDGFSKAAAGVTTLEEVLRMRYE